ncbi:MAG: SusC/RagA family TonB-linked outer membrane protein [Leeuwenhoekiella sp.]
MRIKILLLISLGMFLFHQQVMAQTNEVSGTVTEADSGVPLPGVTVLEKGTNNGTTTDFDGNYSITVPSNATLVFSYVGYSSIDADVNGQNSISAQLYVNEESLDEVVVTALGISRERKSLGYAVTELDGEDVSEVKTTNALNALQGKIAGVNITPPSTGAGGTSRVVIRGASSLTGNNNPLYVVDGVTIDNTQLGAAGPYGGADFGDGISSINPDDIASISVLKGGAAAALYGSRASGGVIIITTKSGGKGEAGLGVEYSSQVTFEDVNTSILDFQKQYGQGSQGIAPVNQTDALDNAFSSWGPRYNSVDSSVQFDGVERPYAYAGNNVSKFYQTGTTIINTVALTKSGEDFNFRFAATNLDNEDIVPNAELNRKSFSIKLNSKMADKLTLDLSARYVIEKVDNRPRVSDAPGNANYTVGLFPGNIDVTDASPGSNAEGTEERISSSVFVQNPYWVANRFSTFDRKNRLLSSATVKYDFTDWLNLTGRAGIDHSAIRTTVIEPFGTAYTPLGSIEERELNLTQVDADLILGFNKDVSEKLSINAFVGANKNTQRSDALLLRGERFVIPFLEILSNVENSSQSRTLNETALSSLYGSFEISYDNWIYLTATGRNDWFSTLSGANKSSSNNEFYPSLSGSLVLSELFDLPQWFSLGRLRAGYSEIAGGAPSPYQLVLPYQIFGQGHLGNPLGQIAAGSVPNPLLTPFSKEETEIGVDLSLFGNRLSLDLAYYTNTTKRDIVPVDISNTSGYGNTLLNLGQLDNQGVEILLSGSPIRNENFRWDVNYNMTFNESEVIATDEAGNNIAVGDVRTFDANISQVVGQPFGVIFGTAYQRNPQGQIVYDASGYPQVAAERQVLGQGVPPWSMGLTNTFNYKGFNLSFLIDAKFGGQVYAGTNREGYSTGLHKETLNGRENGLTVTGVTNVTDENPNGDPFTFTHDDTTLQTYYGSQSGVARIAEEFIEDSDFIKLRQVSIGYNFPTSLLDNSFINSAQLSLVGRNLFFLQRSSDNIDPEAGFNAGNAQGLEYFGLPATRTYGLSLNVRF